MKYKKTLKDDMAVFPTLFPNEKQWLIYVFFRSGNGMEWVNGQLIDIHEGHLTVTERLAESERIREANKERDRPKWVELAAILEKHNTEEFGCPPYTAESIAAYWEKLHAEPVPPVKELGNISKYCCICKLPDNIKLDWLTVARRAYDYALGLEPNNVNEDILKSIGRRLSQLEVMQWE